VNWLVLVLALTMFTSAFTFVVSSPDEFTKDVGISKVFYVYNTKVTNEAEPNRHLTLVSLADNNQISIYKLDDNKIELETEFKLGSRKIMDYIPVGRFLKIVAEGPIMAYMYNPGSGARFGATYIPSDTGELVGKKFVFPASIVAALEKTGGPGPFNLDIYAIETGVVELKNSSGTVAVLPVSADSYYSVNATTVSDPEKSFFELSSTGKVMISVSTGWTWITAPSSTGSIIGNIHYGHTRGGRNYGSFLVIAFEPGQVTLSNMTNPGSLTHTFTKAGEIWYGPNLASPVKVYGDIPTLVQTGYTDQGTKYANFLGQNFGGGRILSDGRVEYWFYVAHRGPAVIFAPEKRSLTVNDTKVDLEADQYYLLSGPGLYHVISDGSVPLQIQAAENAFLIVPAGIPATKPEVTGGGFDMTLIGGAGIAVIVLLIAAFLFLRARKS